MVCCLCIFVPTAHMPRGRTNASTHKELAQGESGDFAILALRGSSWAITMPWLVKIIWN